jgi:hypothetical protein
MNRALASLKNSIARVALAVSLVGALAIATGGAAAAYPNTCNPPSPPSISASSISTFPPTVNVSGKCFTAGGSVFVGVFDSYTNHVLASHVIQATFGEWVWSQWGTALVGAGLIHYSAQVCPVYGEVYVKAFDYSTNSWSNTVSTGAYCGQL